jgi:omega-6 fatty acid desaturase (delta-12 desaturase)
VKIRIFMTQNGIHSPAPRPANTGVCRDLVRRYQVASPLRAVWQIANSVIPYALLWIVMVRALAVSYWLMLPLAILASGFLARIFIIFHDCGHGSFFRSRLSNDITGAIAGVLTLTPYLHWRWQHALHHGTSGNLDKRGAGDIWTLTVREYREASRGKRLAYRLARNPFVLFVIAPLYIFVVHQRLSSTLAAARERRSVRRTNVAILVVAAALGYIVGFKAYLLIQLTVLWFTSAAGIWLFYVQHQFEGAYWERSRMWDYTAAALEGSSFYKLPRVLQWFTGNIGFHHIHHLSPRIPNYHLERCHESASVFQRIKPVTLLSSLRSITFRLWDEQRRQFVGYRPRATIMEQPGSS